MSACLYLHPLLYYKYLLFSIQKNPKDQFPLIRIQLRSKMLFFLTTSFIFFLLARGWLGWSRARYPNGSARWWWWWTPFGASPVTWIPEVVSSLEPTGYERTTPFSHPRQSKLGLETWPEEDGSFGGNESVWSREKEMASCDRWFCFGRKSMGLKSGGGILMCAELCWWLWEIFSGASAFLVPYLVGGISWKPAALETCAPHDSGLCSCEGPRIRTSTYHDCTEMTLIWP